MQIRGCVLLVFLLGGSPNIEADILYSVTDLGTLGGFRDSAGYGINNLGQVTGYSYTAADRQHAFLYSDGQMIDLGTLPGYPVGSVGYGINDLGQITGYSEVSYRERRAFLYSNGQMIDLASTVGYSINNLGQVTGGSGNSAFLYSNGQMMDLGTLGGFYGGFGYGTNNLGQITGVSWSTAGPHAFLYSNGQMMDLGTLGDPYSFSEGRDINDFGQVTGSSYTVTGDGHAFLYSSGQMIDLGSLEDFPYSRGESINNLGQVTGESYATFGYGHAFLYRNNEMVDLNTLIDPGLRLTLEQATGINDRGDIVANGGNHAFLLKPVPEPGTLRLLGGAMLVLIATVCMGCRSRSMNPQSSAKLEAPERRTRR